LDSVLRGFFFEDSSFSQNTLYVWVFVQPLYVPSTNVHFTFGRRLTNKAAGASYESWEITDSNLEEQARLILREILAEGLPYLAHLSTPDQLATNLESATGLRDNVFVREAIAYSLAWIGHYKSALRVLHKLAAPVRDRESTQISTRAEELVAAINASPVSTAKLMNSWTKFTLAHLSLPTSWD
jgi:hypothetical protein